MTTATASPQLPGIPTVASYYPGFETSVWHGFFTTAGTPPAVLAILHREIIKALRSDEVHSALVNGGAESVGDTPDEFAALLTREVAKYAALVKSSGARAE